MERYKNGVARLRQLYASSLAEYNAEAEQNETDELEEAKRQTEDEWREAIEDRVSAVMGQVSDERRKRVEKEEEQPFHLSSQDEHSLHLIMQEGGASRYAQFVKVCMLFARVEAIAWPDA